MTLSPNDESVAHLERLCRDSLPVKQSHSDKACTKLVQDLALLIEQVDSLLKTVFGILSCS